VAVNLAQVDVLGTRGHAHRPFGLGDAQIVGVEVQVAGQTGQFEVGDRGVKMHRSGDVFHMHVTVDLAALGDLAFDLGEGKVVGVAVDGEIALYLVGGEVVPAAGEVHQHRARNGAQMRVPVGGADADARAQAGRGHVSTACVHRYLGGFGHGD